jgi:polyphosphate kinase
MSHLEYIEILRNLIEATKDEESIFGGSDAQSAMASKVVLSSEMQAVQKRCQDLMTKLTEEIGSTDQLDKNARLAKADDFIKAFQELN